MALQGTLKDFGLPDILQLIGIQRKTGILTLENEQDSVVVTFLDGQVVAADTRLRNIEDLLGTVLVRTGRITEAQLREALQTQKNTLQRLGYLLVHSKFISEEDLSEALRIQVCQIVYRLFRWKDGEYNFAARETVEYDQEHFVPVNAETILMEGARMIDEWPMIERRIKSERMVFKKTEACKKLDLPPKSLVEDDDEIDLDLAFEGPEAVAAASQEKTKKDKQLRLSGDERDILRLVDGRSTVREIVDRSALGEFDTYRLLYELLTRNLIAEVEALPAVVAGRPEGWASRLIARTVLVVLVGFAALALASLGSNPVSPWKLGARDGTTDRLRTYASRARLERIEKAIRVFYLETGAVPDALELLSDNGYLRARDLLDPWGRPYGYDLAPGSFSIVGLDGAGTPSEALSVSREFSDGQRMMLDGAASGP